MSTPQPKPGMYKIVFEFESNWADDYWVYRIYRWEDVTRPVWTGTAQTRRGAERKARRVVRKFHTGKLPKQEPPNTIWV